MTIQETLFQAAKMPYRGSVNARYLWVEGLMLFEEFVFSQRNYK